MLFRYEFYNIGNNSVLKNNYILKCLRLNDKDFK